MDKEVQRGLVRSARQYDRELSCFEYNQMLLRMEAGIEETSYTVAKTGLRLDIEYKLSVGSGEQILN